MRLGGFVTGVLGLAALEVVTSTPGAANRTAAIPTLAAAAAQRLLDPSIGLLPNWHDSGAPSRATVPSASQGPANANRTRPGGTVNTRAGAKVRSAPTNRTGPVGPGI